MTRHTPYESTKKKGSWLPILFIFFLILMLGMCTHNKAVQVEAEKKSARKEEAPAINVVTMTMAPKIIRDRISLPGTLAPQVRLVVSTEVAGRLVTKSVTAGTWVNQGDLLGVIDSSKYQNAYNAAKSSYESALSSKNRLEKLFRSELSNKSDLDAITAQMENHQSAMKIAAIDLEKCRITSPISGLVNLIFAEEGQFMDKGNPIIEIIQMDPIKVKVGIPESDVSAVSTLSHFDVSVDALNGKVFKARKNYLAGTTSSLARVYDLELVIDNKDLELRPDMFVRVELVKKSIENALSVPIYSVISADNKQIVYLARKNPKYELIEAALEALGLPNKAPIDTAIARVISTGIQDGWMLEVTEGLQAGDQVITVGQRSVTDGQKIHIIRTQIEQEALVR
ncbi:MAG: efflux RND transporter periplasmic adaptor subunit [Proteobacteria bacterium]|nr:efflux RND transporter periplasmic adaptor subunit [Pseudomonadota bacterium]